MSQIRSSEVEFIEAQEGSRIKQYFHPKNTSNGIRFSIVQCILESGKKSKKHKLRSSEVYYILEGHGKLKMQDKTFNLEKDDSVFVPSNSEQFIENTGANDLKFLCIVDPAWQAKDETMLG